MKCPICGFEGEFTLFRKKDKWHVENSWSCPKCLSKNQHRLIWLVYEKVRGELSGGRLLHCSPMRCLKEKFTQAFTYISIDLPLRESKSGVTKADLEQDLRDTRFSDEYFDLIVCSMVLDFIQEDEKAIRELYRILKSTGLGFIVVPIHPEEKTSKLSERVLGHWWRCGYDYFNKLRKAGFSVQLVKYNEFQNWEDFGLHGEILALCRKKRKSRKDADGL